MKDGETELPRLGTKDGERRRKYKCEKRNVSLSCFAFKYHVMFCYGRELKCSRRKEEKTTKEYLHSGTLEQKIIIKKRSRTY